MFVRPIAQIRNAITIIENVRRLVYSGPVLWNKKQCERIAERYSAIAKVLKSMVGVGISVDVNEASCDGGSDIEENSELIYVLRKGEKLVSGCGSDRSQGITNVICRSNDLEAFSEHHEELNAVVVKAGLQGTGDAIGYTSEMKINILNEDAEVDRKELPEILSQMSDVDPKVAKVVFERMEGPVGKSEALPSYLTIPRSEIKWSKLIREYKGRSKRDLEHEVGWAYVYSGQWLGYKFAIKVFDCRAKGNGDPAAWNQRQLLMEAGSLVELQHPQVTRLVGFGQYSDLSVFVMEFMDGDLRHSIIEPRISKLEKPFKDSEAFNVITQIAKGMYFIHTKGYTHGDLKCSNILVKNLNNQYLEVKIGDLRGSQKHGQWDPKAFEQASRTRRPRWTAPEFIDHDGDKEPSWESLQKLDIYSFGMTCFEIVTGKYPYDGIYADELKQKIMGGEKPELPETLDKGLKELIASCWETNPEERPSFEIICQRLDVIKPSKEDPSWIGSMLNQFSTNAVQNLTESSEILKHEDFMFPKCLNIDPKQLKRGDIMGSGATATVFKITWLNSTYAAKVLKYKNKSAIQLLQEELNSLLKVSRHPCIAQLIGFSVNPDDGECSIIMEYIDGNLRHLIDTRMKKRKGTNWTRPFEIHEEVRIISEFALGMAYLHSRGLVHRDLKSTNMLAQERFGIIDVKIMDFGLSHLEDSLELTDTQAAQTRYYSGYGTHFYRAPEMNQITHRLENAEDLGLPHQENSKPADLQALKATDVYTFAITCYEVLTGCPLKSDLPESAYNAKVITEELRPTWPEDLSSESKWLALKALVESCWVLNPQKRPTFDQICTKLWEIQNSK